MMTNAQKQLKKKLIAAIHCTPRYRNLYADDREAYEALLQEHFGVRSSTQMEISDLIELLEYMKMRRDSLPHKKAGANRASEAQIYRLRQLWKQYARDPGDAALLRFVSRCEGAIPLRVDLLSAKGAQKAIVALRKSLAKKGEK